MLEEHAIEALSLTPEARGMMQRAFDRVCGHRRIIKDTGRAANLAIDMIETYHRGIRTERALVDLYFFAWEDA